MKRLILMFLVGVSIIFFGCSKMDTLAPELNPNDQLTSTLKKGNKKTHFTGICTMVNFDKGIWYDEATDWRVTGKSLWIYGGFEELDESTMYFYGDAFLAVDDNRGRWEIEWYGWQTFTSETEFTILVYAEGIGVGGEVKGLTAKWEYNLDSAEMFYRTTGYIVGK